MSHKIVSLILAGTLFFSLSAGEPKKFDWSQLLSIPPGAHLVDGNQILHFKSQNKPYWESPASKAFVEKYLKEAKPLESDAEILRYASDRATLKGIYIELGVCTGKTINFIAALNPHHRIYGFDSFEGLPEDWIKGSKVISKGTFAFKDPNLLPPVLHNVELIKGPFCETLPDFERSHLQKKTISFLHIDSDLYSSAACALKTLSSHIEEGTIIVFDELYNFEDYENHEWKAFNEFLKQRKLKAEFIAYNIYHEQVAVRIVKP